MSLVSWHWSLLFGIALENCGWEFLSVINREASAWDSGASAPDAFWVRIALTLGSVIGLALLRSLTSLNIGIELQDSLWRCFLNNWSWVLFFSVALEDSSWKLFGIIDGEAAAWDSGALAPDTGWVGIALTLGSMLRLAFIGSLSNRSGDIVIELINSLLRSNLDLWGLFWRCLFDSWSLLLLVASEDGRWKFFGISNREAAAWYGRAGAPGASWISIAAIGIRMILFALLRGLITSQDSHEFMRSHLLVMRHSLLMMLLHLSFGNSMNLMAIVGGEETEQEDDGASNFSFSENSLGHLRLLHPG